MAETRLSYFIIDIYIKWQPPALAWLRKDEFYGVKFLLFNFMAVL